MGKGTSKWVLFLLAMAMVALFGASEVMAQDELPMECTTDEGGVGLWTVTAVPGENGEFPADIGACTDLVNDKDYPLCREYRYRISGGASHSVFLISADQPIILPPLSPNDLYPPCAGDNAGVGYLDCHDRALRVNPDEDKSDEFAYIVGGASSAVAKTVSVRQGRKIGACRIAGAGTFLVDPNQAIAQTEVKKAGPCTLELSKNLLGQITGVSIKLDESDFETCEVTKPGDPITDALLCTGDVLNPNCTEAESGLKFAAGEAASGDNSCYNFFSYGRWYQVCY